jgi:hypothetical protein
MTGTIGGYGPAAGTAAYRSRIRPVAGRSGLAERSLPMRAGSAPARRRGDPPPPPGRALRMDGEAAEPSPRACRRSRDLNIGAQSCQRLAAELDRYHVCTWARWPGPEAGSAGGRGPGSAGERALLPSRGAVLARSSAPIRPDRCRATLLSPLRNTSCHDPAGGSRPARRPRGRDAAGGPGHPRADRPRTG